MAITTPYELAINGYDAFARWGVVADKSLSDALLAPAPAKAAIQSACALEHGVRTVYPAGGIKLDRRDITLELGITAPDRATFLARYSDFVATLTAGPLVIQSSLIPGLRFRCRYVSCSQFTNYNGRLAKFILKLEEPNPANRS